MSVRREYIRVFRDGKPITTTLFQHSILDGECRMKPDVEDEYRRTRQAGFRNLYVPAPKVKIQQ